ncbi:MAG: PTS ascorbate transporter subunit IIC [Candidatus Nanopelagicales bacterium]
MPPRKQYPLRLDPALWVELERWAADDLRSVNGLIEYLLRDAVRRRRTGPYEGPSATGDDPPPAGRAGRP